MSMKKLCERIMTIKNMATRGVLYIGSKVTSKSTLESHKRIGRNDLT